MNSPDELPYPVGHHLLAAIGWLELGNTFEAKHELDRIPPPHCEHPRALEMRWKILAEEQDWLTALVCAEKLVAVAPENESGWIDQSYTLHELKRTREAFERLAAVVGKFPSAYVIPYNLACYQCQLGNSEEALRWLKKAAVSSDAATIRAMAMGDPDLAAIRDCLHRLG